MSISRLTVLLDRDDLACVEDHCPGVIADTLLVFDVDLHLLLRDRNVGHYTPWDLVRHDELPALRALEGRAWEFWTTHARALYRGLDLLRMLPYRHMMCFGRLVWVTYVLRRALEGFAPREVLTFEQIGGHGLDQPAGCDKMPLLFSVVRGLAEQMGISVRLVPRKQPSGFIDWTARLGDRRLDPVDVATSLGDRPYVLLPASGPDLPRQLPLVRGLQQQAGIAAVHVYKSVDETLLKELHDVGHHVWHESQIEEPSRSVAEPEFARCAKQAFDNARRCVGAPLPDIFDNPHMDSHFDFVFGEYLGKLARHVDKWQPFLRKHPPAAVVAGYPNPILEIASHMGIPCLMLSHGLMLLGNTQWFNRSLPAPSAR